MIFDQNSNSTGDMTASGSSYLFPQRGYLHGKPRRDFSNSVVSRGLGGLFDTTDGGAVDENGNATGTSTTDWNSLIATLSQLWLAGENISVQSKVADINLQRAQQGLAPIAFNPTTLQPSVQVGVNSSTQTMIIGIAAGLALLWFLTQMSKR